MCWNPSCHLRKASCLEHHLTRDSQSIKINIWKSFDKSISNSHADEVIILSILSDSSIGIESIKTILFPLSDRDPLIVTLYMQISKAAMKWFVVEHCARDQRACIVIFFLTRFYSLITRVRLQTKILVERKLTAKAEFSCKIYKSWRKCLNN